MIADVQNALAARLAALYPDAKVYLDYVPQNFHTPSFLIEITDHSYGKRLQDISKGTLAIDLQYFSGVRYADITGIRADCRAVQETLLRELDLVGTFRIRDKDARITDDVLHVTFSTQYYEMQISTEPVAGKLAIGSVSVKE